MDNNIVILDGFTTNPGDLSWAGLEALGNLTVYDRTSKNEIIPRSKDAQILLTNKTVISAADIESLRNLKMIGVLATGTNIVDCEAARRHGVTVCNIPSYSTDSVAQIVFAFLLNAIYHPDLYTWQNKLGYWSESRDFSFVNFTLTELAGKTFGIVGFGHIGRKVASIAAAFGMKVVLETSKSQAELPEGYVKMSREELFTVSDVVSLHCPLAPDTEKMVNGKLLSLMKPTAILINTGRGGLLDEDAVAKALCENKLAAVCVDVLSSEPPSKTNPLLNAPRVTVTPHIAWGTFEARRRLIDITVANVKAFLDGSPQNMVN
ncbi:MAG: D-2-hydroxyacid dehydrogenase [Prevotella sp.]|nr:D-2-hydroxyacid dehydrogenase [Bacteroides sp.]MCM1367044.1 D-2-hydroxyacid dehydrogenase [Prevotella sp.]MCM1437532.1 D-2-hydroxyacid dehydrogenase [Prevotella sp.]